MAFISCEKKIFNFALKRDKSSVLLEIITNAAELVKQSPTKCAFVIKPPALKAKSINVNTYEEIQVVIPFSWYERLSSKSINSLRIHSSRIKI